jgi:hypothetical protein
MEQPMILAALALETPPNREPVSDIKYLAQLASGVLKSTGLQ